MAQNSAKRTRSERSRRPAAVAVSVLALGLAVATLEGVLRRRLDYLPPDILTVTGRRQPSLAGVDAYWRAWEATKTADPTLGYRFVPNLDTVLAGHPDFSYRLRTNSRGLRTPREHGPVDGVLIGDSFAFGHGVDESATWAARLKALAGIELANLGVGGYSPLQELRLLQSEGLRLAPRLVVWQLFKDDLWGAAEFQRWLDSGEDDFLAWQRRGAAAPPSPGLRRGPVHAARRLLFRHLLSYEMAKYLLGIGAYADRDRRQVWIRVGGQRLLCDQASNRLWGDFRASAIRRGWELTQGALARGRRLAEAADAHLVVVLVPSKEEVYWPMLAPRLAHAASLPIRQPDVLLAQFCRQQNIPCLDLYQRFASAAQQGAVLYFSRDAHWNAAGHALAAETLWEFLKSHGLA